MNASYRHGLAATLCLFVGTLLVPLSSRAQAGRFQTLPNRGELTYSLPFPELPERAAFGPELSLTYVSMPADALGGFGVGFSLDVPSIQLTTDWGVPQRGHVRLPSGEDSGDPRARLALGGERLVWVGKELFQGRQRIEYRLESADSLVRVYRHPDGGSVDVLGPHGEPRQLSFKGFQVVYPDGRRDIFSEDPALAEGTRPGPSLFFATRWPLQYSLGPNGDVVTYTYEKADDGRAYLRSVEFAGGRSRYELERTPRPASRQSHVLGFPLGASQLYTRLTASFDGEPMHHWCFVHATFGEDGPRVVTHPDCKALADKDFASERKRLSESLGSQDKLLGIYRLGRGSGPFSQSTPQEPLLRFRYTDWTLQELQGLPLVHDLRVPDISGFGPQGGSEFVDIDSDGLVDILRFSPRNGTSTTARNLGEPSQGSPFVEQEGIVLERGNDEGVQQEVPRFDDAPGARSVFLTGELNGDGRADLVQVLREGFPPRLVLYAGQVGKEAPYAQALGSTALEDVSLERGRFRLVDLNADGKDDLLTLPGGTDSTWTALVNVTEPEEDTLRFKQLSGLDFPFPGARSKLDDPAYRFLDVNGDGLGDFAVLQVSDGGEQGLCVYENRGGVTVFPGGQGKVELAEGALLYGDPDARDPLCGQGYFLRVPGLGGGRSLNATWLMDVNRDGLTDVVNLTRAGDVLDIRLGRGRQGFESPLSLRLETGVAVDPDNPWNTRVLDLDGDGSEEILVHEPDASGGRLRIIDFNRTQEKNLIGPELLAESWEGPGLRQAFQYATSTDELIRDRRQSDTDEPVAHGLPFPVNVVKRHYLGVGGETPRVIEYRYHQATLDERDRALLGFARCEVFEAGDASQESAVTRLVYSLSGAPAADRALADKVRSEERFNHKPGKALARRLDAIARMPALELESVSQTAETWRQEPFEVGQPLARHEEQWSRVPLGPDPAGPAFVRLKASRDWRCEGQQCPRSPTESETFSYDGSNRLSQSVRELAAVTGPQGTGVPARSHERTLTYDAGWEARGVLTAVHEEKLVARPSGRLLQSSLSTYSSTLPLPKRVSRKVLLDEDTLARLHERAREGLSPERTREETYQYDPFGNVTEAGDSLGVIARYAYDPTGVLRLGESNALGHTSRSCYGTAGCDIAAGSIPGAERLPARSPLPTHSLTPQGEVQLVEYDALHRVLHVADSSGTDVSYAYRDTESGQRLVLQATRQRAEGPVLHRLSAFRADGLPLGEGTNDEDGGTRVSSFVGYNRGQQHNFEAVPYRLAKSPSALFADERLPGFPAPPAPMDCGTSAGECLAYDALRRSIRQSDPTASEVTRVEYAPWGRRLDDVSQEPSGPSTRTRFEVARGDEVYATVDELGTVRTFERDERGALRSIIIPGESAPRLLLHDSEGRVVASQLPGALARVWNRDLRGRMREVRTWDKDFSEWERVLMDWDGLDRPTSVESSSSRRPEGWDRHSFLYDTRPGEAPRPEDVGQLLQATALDVSERGEFTEHFTYDRSGRTTSRQVLYSGEGVSRKYEERWAYDLTGRVSAYQDPFLELLTFQRGASGALESVDWSAPGRARTPLLSGLRYDERGLLDAYDVPASRLHRTHEYTPDTGRLIRSEACHGDARSPCTSVVQSLSFTRRPDGRVLSSRNSAVSTEEDETTYAYSPRGELLEARRGPDLRSYEYGPAGQVIRFGEGDERPFQPAAGAQLPPLPEAGGYRLDGFGRVVAGGAIRAAEYDPFGRLRRVEVEGKTLVYGYSAFGERVSKHITSTDGEPGEPAQLVVYPSNGTRDDGTQRQSMVRLGDRRPVLLVDGQRVLSVLDDQIGVTRAVVDPVGQTLLGIEYTPYGSPSRVEDASAGTLTSTELVASFTGQLADADTGLVHMGAREYFPALASFSTPDPYVLAEPEQCVVSPLECHLYTYVTHDPINSVDETGLTTRRTFTYVHASESTKFSGGRKIGQVKSEFTKYDKYGKPSSHTHSRDVVGDIHQGKHISKWHDDYKAKIGSTFTDIVSSENTKLLGDSFQAMLNRQLLPTTKDLKAKHSQKMGSQETISAMKDITVNYGMKVGTKGETQARFQVNLMAEVKRVSNRKYKFSDVTYTFHAYPVKTQQSIPTITLQ